MERVCFANEIKDCQSQWTMEIVCFWLFESVRAANDSKKGLPIYDCYATGAAVQKR